MIFFSRTIVFQFDLILSILLHEILDKTNTTFTEDFPA